MYYDFYTSPIGVLYIQATEKGISEIKLIDEGDIHTPSPSVLIAEAIQELKDYFSGQRKEFSVPVDLNAGTAFQKRVWAQLINIPYGKTSNYLTIAKLLGDSKAVRAVGMANGRNPIPIIVPCHRVIGSNGSLVGYAMGVDIKEQLLSIENPLEFGKQQSLF